WWVIAIAAFLFIGFINGLMNPYDEEEHKAEAEQQEAEEKAEAEKKAEEEKKQVEKEKKEESKPKTIELDDFAMAEFSVEGDRKSTRLNSSHVSISYAVFCLKKKKGLVESVQKE